MGQFGQLTPSIAAGIFDFHLLDGLQEFKIRFLIFSSFLALIFCFLTFCFNFQYFIYGMMALMWLRAASSSARPGSRKPESN